MKRAAVFLLFFLFAFACSRPVTKTASPSTPSASTSTPAPKMVKKMVTKKVPGYRLQILNTTNRTDAINAKSTLLTKYPEQKVYLLYQAPYYKIRFGNFENRTDAVSYQKKLKSLFTQVYVIPSEIEVRVAVWVEE